MEQQKVRQRGRVQRVSYRAAEREPSRASHLDRWAGLQGRESTEGRSQEESGTECLVIAALDRFTEIIEKVNGLLFSTSCVCFRVKRASLI